MTLLCDIGFKYGSDRSPKVFHHYTEYYYELLKDKRESIKKVLEIGIGGPGMKRYSANYVNGAGLYMWNDFLPNAQIYGADILPELLFTDVRIKTYQCNQFDRNDLKTLIDKVGNDVDLVIDDGSHIPEHQVFTCLTLMPLLKKDVIYIIEDVRDIRIIDPIAEKYNYGLVMFDLLANKDDRLLIVKNK